MTKEIWLDCDGTWIDLYGVENWLDYLLDENPYPYLNAKPLVNLSLLARTIHQLQRNGFKIGIISWLSKNGSDEYNVAVTEAKMKWFEIHLPSVIFDEIHIVPYGTPKSNFGTGFLFDDEERNRIEWESCGGFARSEKDLIKQLREFLS